jgi:two-component system, response regulator PdtaR
MEFSAAERLLVLIVEDEFLIRMATADVIRNAGFEVVEAGNADDAIAILKLRADIRVVFTDLQIRGSMNGLKLAHAVKDRWPPVHIIATSAYYPTLKDELPVGSTFLPKPCSEQRIVGALHMLTTPH